MSEILILASITLLASISPGPDMIMVVKNAIYSRKLGYMTAIGVGLAVFIHVAYCIAGVGIIISQSILLFSIIKICGAIYLLYISYQLLQSKQEEIQAVEKTNTKTSMSALREGFVTNALNPKATLFFLSVFTQVIDPHTSLVTQIGYGAMMAFIVGCWFMILSSIINFSSVRARIAGIQYYLNKIMGGLLAILGIKILFSSR